MASMEGNSVFKELIKQLSKLNGQRIPIKIPLDSNGYFDRQCPETDCKRFFKVKFQDWKNIVKDEVVYCPICKHESPATEWNTELQKEYIKKQGLKVIQSQISDAMKKDAQRFNSVQKRGFINFSLSYKPGNTIIPVPPEVFKELEQYYECIYCKCHYSFLGTAYFCPACGKENIEDNAKEGMHNIQLFIENSNKIKESYKNIFSEEETESFCSQLIEDQFCKIVSIFQKYAGNLFKCYPGSDQLSVRKNIFQNLDESSIKWKELTGQGYIDIFDSQKYKKYKEYFQIRHLLAHTGGIIDQDFIQKTNTNYVKGKRIVITIEHLNSFYNLTIEFIGIMNEKYKKISENL